MKSLKKIFWKGKKKSAPKQAEKPSEATQESEQQHIRRVSTPVNTQNKPKLDHQKRRNTTDVVSPIRTKPKKVPSCTKRRNMEDSGSPGRKSPSAAELAAAADYYTEPASLTKAYDSIPVLEECKLPRGGCSVDTKAVGRVQVSHSFHTHARVIG